MITIQIGCQLCGLHLSTKEVASSSSDVIVAVGVCPGCAERIRAVGSKAGYENGYAKGYDEGDNRTASQEEAVATSFDLGYDAGYECGYYDGNADGKVRGHTEAHLKQAMDEGEQGIRFFRD